MCLYNIATEYNGPLEATHAQIDVDRYDMVECGAAGKPTLWTSQISYETVASLLRTPTV